MYLRERAVKYAFEWWNKRNPRFYNFDDIGGDCTNFVSQCLYFGGIEMSYYFPGWFYDSLNFRSPSWTGVEEFFQFSISNQRDVGVKAKLVDFSQIEIGDVVQMCQTGENFHHSLLITNLIGHNSFNDIFVTCHSFDAKNKQLSSYSFTKIRFLKILN